MPIPKYYEAIDHPTYKDAPLEEKRNLNARYWKAYLTENPGDEWGKQQAADSWQSLDAQRDLEYAAPIARRALELQRDAANTRIVARNVDREGAWESPEQRQRFLAEKDAELNARQESLKKTFSLFDPEVDKQMQPAWQALTTTALSSGYFAGDEAQALRGPDGELLDGGAALENRKKYEGYRDTLAKDFNLAPEEVDDLVKHRMGLQKDTISRDALGGLHIKDELLVRGVDDIQEAIKNSELPDKVKSDLLVEAPFRVAAFKAGIVENTKKQHPELAAEISWTGDTDKDYQELTSKLNSTRTSQFMGGAEAALTNRLASGAGREFTEMGEFVPADPRMPNEIRAQIRGEAKRLESINQLSSQINQDKVKVLGVDAATVGAGVYSGLESVAIGAVTGGVGNAAISADRIAKAGRVGKILLGGAQRGLNTAPIATIYGVEQGLDTYERTGDVGLSLLSAAIEGGVTTVFGAVKLGGTEDIGQRLANPAVRKTLGKSVAKAWLDFGSDVTKTVTGEQLEELSIATLNNLYVESNLNPGMTVADMKKAWLDTAVSTLFASGPMGALTGASEQGSNLFKSTYEQTNDELHDTADKLYKDAAKENLSSLEDEGGTVPPSGDAGMAPREQMTRGELEEAVAERRVELESIENPTEDDVAELNLLKEGTPEAIAAERGVELVVENQGEDAQQTPLSESAAQQAPAVVADVKAVVDTAKGNDVDLRAEATPSGIILSGITTPQDKRGQGRATQAIDNLKSVADKAGLPVSLTIEPSEEVSKQQLVDFYQNRGFELQEDGETMIYKPAPATPSVEVGQTVLYKGQPVVVEDFLDDGSVRVTAPASGTEPAVDLLVRESDLTPSQPGVPAPATASEQSTPAPQGTPSAPEAAGDISTAREQQLLTAPIEKIAEEVVNNPEDATAAAMLVFAAAGVRPASVQPASPASQPKLVQGELFQGEEPGAIPEAEIPSRRETKTEEAGGLSYAELEAHPTALKKIVAKLRTHKSFRAGEGTLKQMAKKIMDQMVANILKIHDMVPEDIRNQSKLWYSGANKISHRWSKKFGVSTQAVAGVIAAMSPQKDWFQNVSLAERLLSIWTGQDRETDVVNEDMRDAAKKMDSAQAKAAAGKNFIEVEGEQIPLMAHEARLNKLIGKTFDELSSEDKAFFIRLYDSTYNDPSYALVSPDGRFGKAHNNKDGSPTRIAWGSNSEVTKAIRILEDPSVSNISKQLGAAHKIRSFYNNIVNPESDETVTSDTHAVAVAYLLPLSGSSLEVSHNFGGTGSGSFKGTYAFIAEAYRRAAAARGIKPSQMQSITWEAIREIYTAATKRDKATVAKIRQLWDDFSNKRTKKTYEQTAEAAIEAGGGYAFPAWYKQSELDFGDSGTAFDRGTTFTSKRGKSGTDGLRAGAGRGDGRGSQPASARPQGSAEQGTLFQSEQAPSPKGTYTPKAVAAAQNVSKATLELIEGKSDTTTGIHEAGHAIEDFLVEIGEGDKAEALDQWARENVGEDWRKRREFIARGFERYVINGVKTGVESVDRAFARIAEVMLNIYKGLKGSSVDINVPPHIEKIFNELLSRGAKLEAEGKKPTVLPVDVKTTTKATPKPAPAPAPAPAKPKAKKKLPPLLSRTTSLKNAATDRYLAENGMAPILGPARQSNQETWDTAMARVSRDDKAGSNVVNAILQSERSVTDEVEEGVLLHELAVRKARVARYRNAVAEAHGNEDAVREAQRNLQVAQSELAQVIVAAKLAGTAWGRIGQFRQRAIKEDFSLEAMEARFIAEINDGKPLTKDQSAQIAALQKRITEAEAKTAEVEEQLALKEREVQALMNQLEKEKNKKPRKTPERKSVTERMKGIAKQSADRLAARFGRLEQREEEKTDEQLRQEAGFYQFTDRKGNQYEISGGVGNVFRVTHNAKLVATLRYDDTEEGILPTFVGVSPEYRRRGIASYLYDHVSLITGKDILRGESSTTEGAKFRTSYDRGAMSESELARQRSVQDKEKKFFRLKAGKKSLPPVLSVFAEDAASRTGYGFKSRSVIVEMPISEFLEYALPLPSEQSQRARESFNAGVKWESIPALFLDDVDTEKARISGHEGRHRALVLRDAGYTTMPVEIRSMVVRWSEQDDPKKHDYRKTLPTKVRSENGKLTLPYPATRESFAQQKDTLQRLSTDSTQKLYQDPEPELTGEDIEDLGNIAGDLLLDGATEEEAMQSISKQYGEFLLEYSDSIIEAARQQLAKVSAGSRAKTPTELFNLLEPDKEISNKLVFNMVRGFINMGVEKEKVLKKVLDLLKKKFPDLTYDQLSDIFTGYGTVKYPKPDQDLKDVRELRNIERINRQIREIEAGMTPKKTGQQRDPDTDRVRELKKERADAFRKMGIRHRTDRSQLAGALDSLKTRLKNEIADIDKALAEKTPLVKKRTKTDPDTDPEIISLKKQREQRRADYDKFFGINRKEMSDQQRLAGIIRSLNKRIKEERELAAKNLVDRAKATKGKISSAEADALRATLNSLVEMRVAAKAALNPTISEAGRALSRAKTTAQRQVDYYNRLRAGLPVDKKAPMQLVPGEEMARLLALRDEAKAAVAEMRREQRKASQKTPEAREREASIRALERSVAMLEDRVKRGDLSTKSRSRILGPLNEAETELKKRQEAAQAVLKALAEAKRPSLEERRENALIKAAETRMRKIQERIADNDYVKVEKVPREMSDRLAAARLAESKAKEAWNRGFFEKQLAERSFGKKTYDTAAEILNFSRTMKTIADVSAVLRQGLVTFLSRPVLSIKAIPGMFLAGLSETQHQRIKDQIESHPLFALSQQAKLFIADSGPEGSLDKIEEAFRGRWAKKIWGLKSVVGFSERTYNAYLNQVRMASFANMVEGFSGGKPTLKEAKVIAAYVNRATGRGDLKQFESAAAGLAAAFFSPKFVVSRFQVIWGAVPATFNTVTGFKFVPDDVKRAKKAVAKEYARFAIGVAAVYTLAALAKAGFGDDDDEWEIDPRSSNFARIKIGKTTIDPMGGLLQAFTFGARMLPTRNNGVWGPYMKTRKGDVVSLWRPGFGKSSYTGVIGQFLRTKLSPVPASFINVMQGQDVIGQPVTVRSEAIGAVVPLVFGDVFDAFRAHGIAGTPLAVATMFGLGVRHENEGMELEQYLSTFAGVNPQEYERKKSSDTRGDKLKLDLKLDLDLKLKP